ncbi:hypothetical protein J6590_011101 [Homalodisca vitripennis]|nr:hypothetical protein J6590_011101 [Homalodisca vitripennis]
MTTTASDRLCPGHIAPHRAHPSRILSLREQRTRFCFLLDSFLSLVNLWANVSGPEASLWPMSGGEPDPGQPLVLCSAGPPQDILLDRFATARLPPLSISRQNMAEHSRHRTVRAVVCHWAWPTPPLRHCPPTLRSRIFYCTLMSCPVISTLRIHE